MKQNLHENPVPGNSHAHRALLPAIGLTIGFCGLVLLGFEPHYAGTSSFGGNTDDVRAAMVASGICVPGGPSANLLYSNRLIGLVLSQLYSDRPGIAWYGVYLTVSYLLAYFVVAYSVFRITNDLKIRLAATALLLTVTCHFWVNVNFTLIACVLAMAGVALNAGAIMEEAVSERRTPFYGRIISGWLLVIFAGLVRWQAALLMGLTLAPVMLVLACLSWKSVCRIRHVFLAVTAVTVMSGLETWSQQRLDEQPGWREFEEFEVPTALLVNNRRAGKHLYSEDGRSSKEADRAFQAVGWNQNDADLFKYWVFLDEQVYSTRKIASVHAALTAPAPTVSEWTAAVVLVRQKLFSIKKPVNLLFVLLSVVLVLDSCLFVRVSAVLIWTGALILLTVTELLFKLPAHVSGPTLCAAVLSVILIRVFARPARSQGTETSSSDSIPSRSSSVCGRLSTIALAGSLCLSTYLVTHYYSYSRLGVRYRRPFLNCVDRLEKGPDHIYLIVLQFPFQRTSLFDTMAAWEDWHFIYTDGDVRSPRYYTFLKEHNIDDLTTALYTDPRLHIITIEPVMTRITQFLKDHRGVDVEYSVRDMPPIKVFSLRERTIDSSETL